MKIAAIIPDRNDRPDFTERCLFMMGRQTYPIEVIHVNYNPKDSSFDLTQRIKYGIDAAKANDIDFVFIIENDDYYPKDYIKRLLKYTHYDIIGSNSSIYYNLQNRTHFNFSHPGRASLFTTGFRLSAIRNIKLPSDDYINLDLHLWKNSRMLKSKFVDAGAIGIKHGKGLCGGKGHSMIMVNKDPDLRYLRSATDRDMFDFYKSI